jgi:hypothetical protein
MFQNPFPHGLKIPKKARYNRIFELKSEGKERWLLQCMQCKFKIRLEKRGKYIKKSKKKL